MSLAQAHRSDPVMTAPALRDSGRPLDQATRSSFEAGFGRDFSNIRVHDDAHAHESARGLDARAYAAGDHIVFGAGHYQPETAAGRALIAHELAHTVQQAGVAMKSDGPLPAGSDARLEAEADRAAVDVLSGRGAPALSSVNRPVVFRNPANTPLPTAGGAVSPSANPTNIPPKFSIDPARPPQPGANEVTIWLDYFKLPQPKGAGAWVNEAYKEATDGGRLGTTLFANDSFASWKEQSKSDEYFNAWLNKHGFKGLREMALAITQASKHPTAPLQVPADVTALLANIKKGKVSELKCDIDHIVEKQMGGTSQPRNLQILTSTVNQASGREAYKELKLQAQRFIDFSPDWKNVTRIAMRIKKAEADAQPNDPSVQLEQLLRDHPELGNAKTKAAADHKPLYLSAGGVGETIHVKDTGETPVDETGVRLVPGAKLALYRRAAAKTLPDIVVGELDHRAMQQAKTGKGVEFQAKAPPATAAPAVAADAAQTPDVAATSTATTVPANTPHREIKLEKGKFKELEFFYPYLSPGTIKSVDLDPKGQLTGTGVIRPSVKFLPNLEFSFGPDEMNLATTLDHKALNATALMQPLSNLFRFTGGKFELNLMKFVPKGTVTFSMGPAANPVLTGDLDAKVEGGAFVVTGKLVPGKLPGISAAEGRITYNSSTGWLGTVRATSSTLPGATSADVTIGVRGADKLDFFGEGLLITKVRKSELKLKARWEGGSLSYWGGVTVPNPMPLVESVYVHGSYANGLLNLTGEVKGFTWKDKFTGDLVIHYLQKDGEEGRFSGNVEAKTGSPTSKMDGFVKLKLGQDGKVSGLGEVSYQVSKDLRPKLGVELVADPTYRLRLFGQATWAKIPLTGEWPKPGGEKKDIIKGLGVKISLPVAPVPGLSVYFEAKGSFGVSYGIGPLALTGVKFDGELWPLEADPKIKAQLTGRLSAPGFAGLYGTFGAKLGAEVFAGALGLNGGIEVTPSLKLIMDAGIDVNAAYSAEKGFAFEALASVKAALEAQVAFVLTAQIYGAYGLLEYTWTHPLNEPKPKRLGPELKVTLGKIAYSKDQGIVWPSLDQIDYSPKEFDPKSIITDLLTETKAQEA